ncbi:MAG: hypothetical protein PHU29_07965 [Sulfuricurvum sp.]|nr:hypothetical protein [Sulfuricurvum sp.]
MKQPSTFEDLQALGTEKIHERTHISRDKVELVLTKSYGDIGRVQFMGFMSILEREYGIDLNEIKEEYTKFYQDHIATLPPKQSVILQSSSNSKPKWILAGIILIAMLMIAGYIAQGKMSNEPREEVMKLSVPTMPIKDAMIDTNVTDTNETNSTIVTANSEKNATKPSAPEPTISGKGLIIHPIYKVWYGMIDMATGKRIQKITTDPIRIDTTKNWLIFLGHGRLEVESSSGKIEFKQMDPIRFICENGVLKELNKDEFIERNGGKDW